MCRYSLRAMSSIFFAVQTTSKPYPGNAVQVADRTTYAVFRKYNWNIIRSFEDCYGKIVRKLNRCRKVHMLEQLMRYQVDEWTISLQAIILTRLDARPNAACSFFLHLRRNRNSNMRTNTMTVCRYFAIALFPILIPPNACLACDCSSRSNTHTHADVRLCVSTSDKQRATRMSASFRKCSSSFIFFYFSNKHPTPLYARMRDKLLYVFAAKPFATSCPCVCAQIIIKYIQELSAALSPSNKMRLLRVVACEQSTQTDWHVPAVVLTHSTHHPSQAPSIIDIRIKICHTWRRSTECETAMYHACMTNTPPGLINSRHFDGFFVVVLFIRFYILFSLRFGKFSENIQPQSVSHVNELFVPSSVTEWILRRTLHCMVLSLTLQPSSASYWIEWPKPTHIAPHFRMNMSHCLWLEENVMEMEYWQDLSRRLAEAGWLAVPWRHQCVCVRRWDRFSDANEHKK